MLNCFLIYAFLYVQIYVVFVNCCGSSQNNVNVTNRNGDCDLDDSGSSDGSSSDGSSEGNSDSSSDGSDSCSDVDQHDSSQKTQPQANNVAIKVSIIVLFMKMSSVFYVDLLFDICVCLYSIYVVFVNAE